MVWTGPSPSGMRPATLLLLVTLVLSGASRAAAAEKEVREFTTLIDRKPAGNYRMTISADDQGTVTMEGNATITLSIFRIKTYSYSYHGVEVWKDGRLIQFSSATDDDGKKYTVNGKAEKEGFRVSVNERERVTRGDVWVTTYWRLPDAKFRGQPVALLDADTGLNLGGTLQYVGLESLNVANQQVNCAHYRVTGDVTVDFWYDGTDRLVHQEWVEDRHRVVLHLTSISR